MVVSEVVVMTMSPVVIDDVGVRVAGRGRVFESTVSSVVVGWSVGRSEMLGSTVSAGSRL